MSWDLIPQRDKRLNIVFNGCKIFLYMHDIIDENDVFPNGFVESLFLKPVNLHDLQSLFIYKNEDRIALDVNFWRAIVFALVEGWFM